MRKVLAFVSGFIAFVLAMLFVVTALAALPLFNIGLHLFSPDVYKRALAAQHFYDRLPAVAAEQLDLQIHYTGPGLEEGGAPPESPPEPGGGAPPTFVNLSRGDWEQFLSALLPPDWLRAQTESVLDQAFAILDSTDPRPEITVSLAELKARVGGEAGVNAFLQLVRAQPPCTQEELKQWAGEGVSGLPTCRPPEELLTAATPQIQAMLSGVVADLPDEADLTQIFKGEGESETPPPEAGGPVQEPLPFLRTLRLGLRLSPLIPVALLLLVALFAVRSRKGLLRWWGIPLLLAGLVGAALAVAILPAMKFGYVAFVAGQLPPYLSDGLVQAGLDVVWQIAGTLAGWIGGEAALIGLIGLTMFAASFLLKEKQN